LINIDIDTADLSAEFNLSQEDVEGLMQYTIETVTSEFALMWDQEAAQSLMKSRDQYRNALQVDSRGRFTGVVYLNPAVWIANAIELGAEPFDMKPGMLSSPKAKTGADGSKYMSIPFRFGTPGALAESSVFAGVMPSDIHSSVLKSEKAGTPLQMGSIASKHHMPKSHAYRNQLKAIGFDKMKKGTKTTSKYAGLQRNARGSGYVNFRRVSEKSDPEAFLHPGVQARHLGDKAYSRLDIPSSVDEAIDNFLANM